MNHYSLGLEKRDRVNNAFGGGLPEGSLVLVEGGTGAGKSVLASRVVYGLCEEGTSVGVASTAQSVGEYVSQMHSLSYGVVDHLLEDRLRYFRAQVDSDQRLVDRFLRPSPLWDRTAVVADGFGALCRNDPELGPVLGTEDADLAMERVTARIETALAANTLIVLTVDPTTVGDRALGPLRSAADVFLDLRSEVVGQSVQRTAVVRRFAGMKDPVDDTISFSVQQGRGVVIESRTVA